MNLSVWFYKKKKTPHTYLIIHAYYFILFMCSHTYPFGGMLLLLLYVLDEMFLLRPKKQLYKQV